MAVNTDPLPTLPAMTMARSFAKPWEAHAFALAVRLSEANCFTWSEWRRLSVMKSRMPKRRGDPDLGSTYYHHWVRALERLCVEKGLANRMEVLTADARVARCYLHTPHGQPVELSK